MLGGIQKQTKYNIKREKKSNMSSKIKKRNYDLDIKNLTDQEEEIIYSSTELMQMLETSFTKSNEMLNKLKEAVK